MDSTFDDDQSAADPGLRLRMRGQDRRISSQHKQLGELFELTLGSMKVAGPREAVSDFLLFQTALEAHMSVEEDIYFPALHGLRDDVRDELVRFVEEHRQIRAALNDVKQRMAKADEEDARVALAEFANRLNKHEGQEEDLLTRISEGPVGGLGHTSLEGGGGS